MLAKAAGIIKFRARGIKLYTFMNELRSSGITCTSQECSGDEYYGEIYSFALNETQALAKKHNIEFAVIQKKGFIFKLIRYRFRFGLPIGLALALAFIFYVSNIVVTVEVTGNETVPTSQIIQTLEDMGISKGAFIPSLDFGYCERQLKIGIKQLSWAGIRHTGNRLVVDVTEIVEKPEMFILSPPANVIAAKDAQIKSATVYRGSLERIVGDGVKKGDVIISGIYTDHKENIIKTRAYGDIVGIYDEAITFEQPFSQNERIAGKEVRRRDFEFFSFRIPLGFGTFKAPDYDCEETLRSFMFFGRPLPFGIIHKTYTPYTAQTLNFTPEEALARLERKIKLHEINFYENKTVLSKTIDKREFPDRIEYEVSYRIEGDIGQVSEVFISDGK
ncbi:MAG: sporulation protein YqfD [Oscillospiraceae bacterium]|jgi:similar to stage IV sporulation protein|nr:sporulation protein YqfD [Oscillospiraceae bacterium]